MNDDKASPNREKQEGGARESAIAVALAEFLDRTTREEFVDVEAFCRERPGLEEDLRPLSEMDPKTETGSEQQDPLPERLSGHKILGEIGAGGMGRVLLAQDEGLNRKIAVKVLSAR